MHLHVPFRALTAMSSPDGFLKRTDEMRETGTRRDAALAGRNWLLGAYFVHVDGISDLAPIFISH